MGFSEDTMRKKLYSACARKGERSFSENLEYEKEIVFQLREKGYEEQEIAEQTGIEKSKVHDRLVSVYKKKGKTQPNAEERKEIRSREFAKMVVKLVLENKLTIKEVEEMGIDFETICGYLDTEKNDDEGLEQ